MKKVNFLLGVILMMGSLVVKAEDSLSCDDEKTQLILADDGEIILSSKELMSHFKVIRTEHTHQNVYGIPTQIELTVDDGSDARNLLYQFGKLNQCEGETSLKIFSVPFLGEPKLLKEVTCDCTQS